MVVINTTDQSALVDATPLDPHVLALTAQEAAAEFIAAGTAANTVRSYRSALAYWSAWLQLRYGQVLGESRRVHAWTKPVNGCARDNRCRSRWSSIIW